MNEIKSPAYQVIYQDILKKINKGKYSKEVAIPSENELATKYEVSRMTARKAVDLLVNEGYLCRQKGKGTFITGRRNLERPSMSLLERINGQDLRVYTELVSFELSNKNPQGVFPEEVALEGLWHGVRHRYIQDEFALLEEFWIPKKILATFNPDEATNSLVALLKTVGEPGRLKLLVSPHSFEEKADARLFNRKKRQPVLKVEGRLEFLDGTLALYSEGLQDPLILPFEQDMIQ